MDTEKEDPSREQDDGKPRKSHSCLTSAMCSEMNHNSLSQCARGAAQVGHYQPNVALTSPFRWLQVCIGGKGHPEPGRLELVISFVALAAR
jgi:hypothetical protein